MASLRDRPGARRLASGFIGAALGLIAVVVAVRLSGRVVQIPSRMGEPTGTLVRMVAPDTVPTLLQAPAGGRARNIILIVADGLGFSHLAAARAELSGVGGRLLVERLPVAGWVHTHAAGSIYTDSASAATAMATGRKTAPGLLGVAPDGEVLTTVAEAARNAGMAVGLITDSYLWDATPAGFVAHGARRDYDAVAAHMSVSGAAILAGETRADLAADDDDGSALIAGFRDAGYQIRRDAGSWSDAVGAGAPTLGLFPPGSISDPNRSPQLPDLAAIALERLSQSPGGYFLLVETEEADSGSHVGDLRRVFAAVRSVEAIVERALAYAQRDGDTLILFTADHETGGLMLLSGFAGEPLRIRWGTTNHTAEPVPLFAYGPGAERFAGLQDNTDIGRTLIELVSAAQPVGAGRSNGADDNGGEESQISSGSAITSTSAGPS